MRGTITPSEVRVAMQADRAAGMPVIAVAKKYGVSTSTVTLHAPQPPRRVVTDRIARAMQADRDRGLSGAQIAKRHGCSKSSAISHTTGMSASRVSPAGVRAMQADRDTNMTVAAIAEKHGWSEQTVCRHTSGPRCRHKPDLARLQRFVAANASPEADRDAIAARFGLANRRVLSVFVARGNRLLRDGEPQPVRASR